MSLVITTEPAVEPVTLTEAKAHLRVEHDEDDSTIGRLITVARRYFESVTWRQLVTATYALKLDAFPCGGVIVPRPPLQSVSSITYEDENDATQTLATTEYTVDAASFPGRIVPAFEESWPSTLGHINDVTITYVAGYGLAASVPAEIKQILLMHVWDMYHNRAGCEGVPAMFDVMLAPHAMRDVRLLEYL